MAQRHAQNTNKPAADTHMTYSLQRVIILPTVIILQ
jgi:hypothetical protein